MLRKKNMLLWLATVTLCFVAITPALADDEPDEEVDNDRPTYVERGGPSDSETLSILSYMWLADPMVQQGCDPFVEGFCDAYAADTGELCVADLLTGCYVMPPGY